MLWQVETPVTVNYDSDIILPTETYIAAQNMIVKEWRHPDVKDAVPPKVVYPYGYGNYQYQLHIDDTHVTNFINSNFDFTVFNGRMRQWDDERYFRFNLLSSVARINDNVYHMEHGRTKNSWFNNPYCEDNKKLWEELKIKGSKGLKEYYNDVAYLRERNGEKQVSV